MSRRTLKGKEAKKQQTGFPPRFRQVSRSCGGIGAVALSAYPFQERDRGRKDGTCAYAGSANLTGAGMGAESDRRRKVENIFFTADPALFAAIMGQFDWVWMGVYCTICLILNLVIKSTLS
jgi:hypothetical protein